MFLLLPQRCTVCFYLSPAYRLDMALRLSIIELSTQYSIDFYKKQKQLIDSILLDMVPINPDHWAVPKVYL